MVFTYRFVHNLKYYLFMALSTLVFSLLSAMFVVMIYSVVSFLGDLV